MNITLDKFNKFFNRFFLVNFLILSIGIPLLFSSYTRSVFEVNKLLLLRLVILLVYGAWILKSCLLKDNKLLAKKEDSYSFFGFRWRRIGLEIPILIWIILNLLSIFFSKNIFIAYIGAYDRWEGIATVFNYILLFYMVAKLLDDFKYRLLIIMICLFSTSISSIYGIVQSLGIDFMSWSTSPTSRVFACINNPVHFCAYVGMLVPIGISLTYYFITKLNSSNNKDLLATPRLYYLSLPAFILLGYIFTFRNTFNFLAFTQYILLIGSFFMIFKNFNTLIPSKKTSLYIGSLVMFVIGLFSFNLILLDRFQITIAAFSIISFFVLRVINNKTLFLYRLCFATTLIVFYSMLLSFSRATIIGFAISMTLFYQLILSSKSFKLTRKHIITLFFSSSFIHICLIFKLNMFGTIPAIIELIVLFFSCIMLLLSSSESFCLKKLVSQPKSLAISLSFFSLLCIPFINISALNNYSYAINAITIVFCTYFYSKIKHSFYLNCLSLFLLLNITFYFSSFSEIINLITLLLLAFISFKNEKNHPQFIFNFYSIFLFFALLIFIPTKLLILDSIYEALPTMNSISSILNFVSISFAFGYYLLTIFEISKKKLIIGMFSIFLFYISLSLNTYKYYEKSTHNILSDELQVANTIRGRMKSLSSNKARLYMWKSVPPWILNSPLLGTGPDTIRHLYPQYRHPKYGIHEGGHNFTPDRLHNEYLNTLVTKGILGFVVKYILFYGGWFLIMISILLKYSNSSKRFFLIGIISSPCIYLVQVLFNFGVVATLFLFYFLLGIGLSFVNDEYNEKQLAEH